MLAGSDDKYAYADYGAALVVVVLGERFPKWQVAGAREVCEGANVVMARVRWMNGRPHAGSV